MLASRRGAATLRASVPHRLEFPASSRRWSSSAGRSPSVPRSSWSWSRPRFVSGPVAGTLLRQYAAGPRPPPKTPPDHRDLGVQQELFTTSIYSPGSPIFLPNGARVFNRLVDFLRKQYVRYGFQEVITPTIYKKALWAKSGHLENYADDMFTVTSASLATGERRGEGGATPGPQDLEDEYGLKPMNCPGHCLIFAAQRHSYRDLPIRYADFSPLHRDELSGALSGLTRVRRFHQDDGHVFCRPDQVEAEIRATLDFVRHTYDVLGLGPYRLVLSTRPLDGHLIGTADDWDAAEDALRRALDHSHSAWTVSPGDGAFYGPKIDVVLRDSDGKEHQTATVQLDFQLPKRFALTYQEAVPKTKAEVEAARPVLIHRAVLGSVERLMALLIEHYDGRWPFWLNPRQVAVLTVNDSEPVVAFARHVQAVLNGTAETQDVPLGSLSAPTLLAAVDLDDSARTLPLKVREARSKGYGAVVVVGPKDVARGTVAVDLSGIPVQEQAERSTKSVDMKPEELLALLLQKASTYQ
ncbi:threonyl-tRNA synthetase [Grosmannia clavigera kw1407]|uniref:threonine--tRNA ligase n=1 Tax=Grosmannia clavigera (strain kw1407 / UAMH 11150) TaxID=655863 RepID=F0XU21_GROCL|nr:threonyl-tRNA synthetase [Grosmannia clavigera kw1407]EFW98994.1 threonyl-tRNA synthetase [Grosmannia clavigera kw1407]